MRKSNKILVATLAAACVLSLTASAEGTRGELVFGDGVYVLDPASSVNNWWFIRHGVGETLFKFDDDFNTCPYMLEDYSVADDQLTWTLQLKDGITFQNGNPCDAAAVKASLERLVGMNEIAASDLDIDTMEADGLTLVLKTKNPVPSLPNNLARPQTGIVDVTEDADFEKFPIGTGPYKVVEYVEGDYERMEAYDGYWQGTPGLDSVVFRSTGDNDSKALAMQNGELDVAYGLSYDLKDQFDADPNFKITSTATSRVYMCYFNFDSETMQDKAVRDAITMAVNREGYCNALINGAGTPSKAAFPAYTTFGQSDDMTAVPDYDMEAAAKVLEDAGYADTDGDGFLDKDGNKLEIKIATYGRVGLPQSSQALQSSLVQLGIDASYEQVDSIDDYLAANPWDVSVYAYVTMPTGDPYAYLNATMATDGYANFGHYSNPEIDALLKELQAEFDVDKRSDLTVKIQQLATEDAAYCYLFHLNMYMPMKASVENITQNPSDYYYVNWNTTIGE